MITVASCRSTSSTLLLSSSINQLRLAFGLITWALGASMSRRFCAGDALAGDASAFAAAGLGDDRLAVDARPGDAFSCVPHGARLGFALPDGEECW